MKRERSEDISSEQDEAEAKEHKPSRADHQEGLSAEPSTSDQAAYDGNTGEEEGPGPRLSSRPSSLKSQQPALTKEERDRQKRSILTMLTEEQLNRYEAFRRSSLPRPTMKRLLQGIVGQMVNVNITIIVCGIAKLFVGELIETARAIAEEQGQEGPLQPDHIHAAYQRLDQQGKVPHRTAPRKRLLR